MVGIFGFSFYGRAILIFSDFFFKASSTCARKKRGRREKTEETKKRKHYSSSATILQDQAIRWLQIAHFGYFRSSILKCGHFLTKKTGLRSLAFGRPAPLAQVRAAGRLLAPGGVFAVVSRNDEFLLHPSARRAQRRLSACRRTLNVLVLLG